MNTIGILCERVRVEEKQILDALRVEGLPAVPVPPMDVPIPIGTDHADPSRTAGLDQFAVLIDRCPERSAGSHLVSLFGDLGVTVLGAGVASTGNRLDVARTLEGSGIPRPRSVFAGSEKAGLAALRSVGYPATLMPLTISKRPQPIFDEDIAEAVLEHRHTLGSVSAKATFVQEGSPSIAEMLDVMVVDGSAVACSLTGKTMLRQMETLQLAERAAAALSAQIIDVRIAQVASGVAVWDINPVPDFRTFNQIGPESVAGAIGKLVAKHHPAHETGTKGARDTSILEQSTAAQKVAHGVVISA